MRKLIFGINITLDGCVDHTKGIADEEVHTYFANLLKEADTIVYGRKTYELMVPFWPDLARAHAGHTNAMNEFAQAFYGVKKLVVFSHTLDRLDYEKATVAKGDLRETILKLKAEDGKDISLGGVDIPSQLMELDLIDEYHFVVQPLIVGEGRRLMEASKLAEKLTLKLAGSKIFKSGCIALHFIK